MALAAAGLLAPAALTATHDAPPGATARCNDSTYSYSQTRSGTCSHHGGVAVWLAPSTTPQPAAPTPVPTGAARVRLGDDVALAARTKTSGCRLGPVPDRRCSPGAYFTGLSKAVLCSPSFHTGSVRHVPESEKHAVEAAYGLAPRSYGSTLEIDHIVSLELGGSNDIGNLFPERAAIAGGAGYHVKDKLENRLHAMVCDGRIGLRAAQRQIASDWEALYRRVFGVSAVRRLASRPAVAGG